MKRTRRMVAEIAGRHRGETIWIAGSDPSLAEYPGGFLDGKLGMTLHLAHRKFPNSTYRYSSEYDRSAHLISIDDSYARKPLVAALPMYGKTEQETEDLLAGFDEVYFHRMRSYPPTGVRGEVDPEFTRWKVRSTAEGNATLWGAHGTCLHLAIYMAVLMGTAHIRLIGAGHGMYKPEHEHFPEAEADHLKTRPQGRSFADPVEHVPLIEQTLALAEACREIGIDFTWYRTWTPLMDDIMKVDPDWLADEKKRAVRRFSILRRAYWTFVKRPLNRVVSRF